MKLVRDRIPDIIRAEGREPNVRVADVQEFGDLLLDKVLEEADEVWSIETREELVEEIADLTEVLVAVARVAGISQEEVERARAEKTASKGGFEKRYVLLDP